MYILMRLHHHPQQLYQLVIILDYCIILFHPQSERLEQKDMEEAKVGNNEAQKQATEASKT